VAGFGHLPRPWLALGISRSTYYRRRAKAREQAAQAHAAAVFDRLAWQVAELRTHLDRLAAANAIMAAELSLFERVPSTIPSRA
jgi:hypothetical protein